MRADGTALAANEANRIYVDRRIGNLAAPFGDLESALLMGNRLRDYLL